MLEVSERYIERRRSDMSNLSPRSAKQKEILRDIRTVLKHYLVKGDGKDLDRVALEIWRVTRR